MRSQKFAVELTMDTLELDGDRATEEPKLHGNVTHIELFD